MLAAVGLAVGSPSGLQGEAKGDTLVVSRVHNGYSRTKLPEGGYSPETYAFAEGGLFDDDPVGADSVSTISFAEVARTVADALKTQNYVPSADPSGTELMIMLWYGTTKDLHWKPVAYSQLRARNARILGFQNELSRADSLSFTTFAGDFFDEFYSGRYFVVLKAYDFQVARKEKRLKLLWETRFSLRRQSVDFASELPSMSAFAAHTFGRETNGIVKPDTIETNVEFGELKILGVEEP